MADTFEKHAPPVFRDADSAPFIYFDVRTMRPDDGGINSSLVTTARLRCSPAAAMNLRNAIDKALGLLQQPPETGVSATLN